MLSLFTSLTVHAMTITNSRNERGANLIEYTLLIALIALVCVVAVTQLGTDVRDKGFESITTSF